MEDVKRSRSRKVPTVFLLAFTVAGSTVNLVSRRTIMDTRPQSLFDTYVLLLILLITATSTMAAWLVFRLISVSSRRGPILTLIAAVAAAGVFVVTALLGFYWPYSIKPA